MDPPAEAASKSDNVLKNWQKASILERNRSMDSPASFSRRKYNSDSNLAESAESEMIT